METQPTAASLGSALAAYTSQQVTYKRLDLLEARYEHRDLHAQMGDTGSFEGRQVFGQ